MIDTQGSVKPTVTLDVLPLATVALPLCLPLELYHHQVTSGRGRQDRARLCNGAARLDVQGATL